MCVFWVDFTKKLTEKFTQRGDHENCDIQKLKTQWKSFRMAVKEVSELSLIVI